MTHNTEPSSSHQTSKLTLKLPSSSEQQLASHSPQNWKTDGRGKSLGSRRTQFKPGANWTGNKGGRPRALTDAYRKWLAEEDEKTGRTNAEEIALNMIEIAKSDAPHSVSAGRELRLATESDETGSAHIQTPAVSPSTLAMIQRLVGE